MTDGTAGWFRDPNDETLARWHDGKSWTEHTLVIADQPPGVEPAPPEIAPEPDPEPAPPPTFVLPPRPAVSAGRDLPGWFKVAGPLAVVALLVVAFVTFSGDDGDPNEETSTVDTVPASLDDAVDAARRAGLADEVSDPRAAALISRICEAAEQPTGVDQLGEDLASLPADSPSELRQQVGALGVGANERCPEELEDAPDLVDELQELAVTASATTTTLAPDVLPTDGGTDAGVTDGGDDGDGGSDSGTRSGSRTGRTTSTTRRAGGGAAPTTTAAPAPTTTLPGVLKNSSCSSEGAKARDKVSGGTLTCQKACTNNRLQWRSGPCPTNPPPPTTAPGQTTPTPTTAPPPNDL